MANDSVSNTDRLMAEAALRREAMAKLFAARPIEDVIGLISARGVGGWKENDGSPTLSFTFERWRISSGELKPQPMDVTFNTSQGEFDTLWNQLKPYAVVRIRGRVVEQSILGDSRCQMAAFGGFEPAAADLSEIAIDLQKPVIQQDEQFGPLTFQHAPEWFSAETEWNGKPVTLILPIDETGNKAAALRTARSLWIDQKGWTERIEECAVDELLSAYNDNWRDEEDLRLSAEQFKQRMGLGTIEASPDGRFEFGYNDDGMFAGHSIVVYGTLTEGPTWASIEG